MTDRRAIFTLIVAATCLASCATKTQPLPPVARLAYMDPFKFLNGYRIEHYLESAMELQKLQPNQRVARLKALAVNPNRSSELFPLCRMLFEAKPKGEFRRPMIGAPVFIDDGKCEDWPLEPITLFESLPILIASQYMLAGQSEPPGDYLDYCLAQCKWRDAKYEAVSAEKRKEIVEKFIAANPNVNADAAASLRLQAD